MSERRREPSVAAPKRDARGRCSRRWSQIVDLNSPRPPRVLILATDSVAVQLRPQAAARLIVRSDPKPPFYLDGRSAGKAGPDGQLVLVLPGSEPRQYALRVTLAGGRSLEQTVTLTPGRETTNRREIARTRLGRRITLQGPIRGTCKSLACAPLVEKRHSAGDLHTDGGRPHQRSR